MKNLLLTQEFTAIVDDDDYDSLCWYSWHVVKGRTTYYARTMHNRKNIWMHRFILNAGPNYIVDHKDGNGLNNTRSNIELTSHSINAIRRTRFPKNSTGFRGVSWNEHARKYSASIMCARKSHHLGYFVTKEEAAHAYDEAAITLFGKDAPRSFIPGYDPVISISVAALTLTELFPQWYRRIEK